VFDRFVRLSPGGSVEGSGLGLAISRTLADALGARLSRVPAMEAAALRCASHCRRRQQFDS
jgi:K+-sensing histidine kinase KdpD